MLYELDGKKMTGRKKMHEYLREQFLFPDYYGNNLDAFWDCMTEKRPGEIHIFNAGQANQRALVSLIRVLLDLTRFNPNWILRIDS